MSDTCDPMNCSPPGSFVHGIFPSKNTGVDCHFLLQGIFLTQILPGSPALQAYSLPTSYLEEINNKISVVEEWISELEDTIVEITSEEQNKIKRMKRIDDSLRDLWDNIKCTNIWIIGVPEEEEKRVSEKFWRD